MPLRPWPVEPTRLGLGRESPKTLKFQRVAVSLPSRWPGLTSYLCGGKKGEQAGTETGLDKQREQLSLFLLNTSSRRRLEPFLSEGARGGLRGENGTPEGLSGPPATPNILSYRSLRPNAKSESLWPSPEQGGSRPGQGRAGPQSSCPPPSQPRQQTRLPSRVALDNRNLSPSHNNC